MLTVRPSVPEDVPAQRELWQTAFGDSDAYLDNFYHNYYRPERVVVLEEDGAVRSMTAWFDTTLVVPGREEYRTAYLYAVATRPDCRGRGLAGRLLAGADGYFRTLGISAVTTQPAQPSLHDFFGANGFGECFCLIQSTLSPEDFPPSVGEGTPLRPVSPAEYKAVRDAVLSDCPYPYVVYPEDALAYQAGCCALGGGGLYVGETSEGPVCLCAEGDGQGTMIFKELLGCSVSEVLPQMPRQFPAQKRLVRMAPPRYPGAESMWKFAMLKWLDPALEKSWDWDTVGYLGLAFD